MKTFIRAIVAMCSFGAGSAVFAAATVLSDVPVITQSRVPFNILFTLDNSGSMYYTVPSDPQLSNYQKNCYRYYKYNRLYFDPSYVYLAPRKFDGGRMDDQSFAAAMDDGYDSDSNKRNLGTQFGAYPKDNSADFDSSLPSGNAINVNSSYSSHKGAYYFEPKSTASAAVKDGTSCGANSDYVGVAVTSAAMQKNFANWYSYYRTRVMSMKVAVGEAFYIAVSEDTRVGFHTINSPSRSDSYGGFLPLKPFVGPDKEAWYKRFYEQTPSGSTPLRLAEQRAGEYFQKRLSPATNKELPVKDDPIQYYCQRNYHMLSTDGYWNTGAASGDPAKNNDNTIPDFDLLVTALNEEIKKLNRDDSFIRARATAGLGPLKTVKGGDPWIPPYREKAGSNSSNTLSDVATYFWATDLRPDTDPVGKNEVFVTSRNPAKWQHMVTYGISFGAKGSVAYDPPDGVLPEGIRIGSSEWPVPVENSSTAVDDLWHASVNSRGLYANVFSAQELVNKVTEMLKDAAEQGTLANIGVSNPVLAQSNNLAFKVKYDPIDWTGNLIAHSIDPITGAVAADSTWEAQARLDQELKGEGWKNRLVATWNSASKAGVAFKHSQLSPAQQLTLGGTTSVQQAVVNFIRGDTSNQGSNPGQFRVRASLLGDIVNSEPVVVGPPRAIYHDAYNPGYSAFKDKWVNRRMVAYVGANDGMLHAFDATKEATGGKELWAYVPGALYRAGADGLAALSYSLTALPKYSHRFYVDQTPNIRDVDFENRGAAGKGTPDWRSLLVAGLNKGGKGYYALDVTQAGASDEAAAISKVLWEFTDPKMGYTYGRPVIVKTARFGWVVIVSSGIGNNDENGRSYIWVLRAKTGEVLHRFETPAGVSTKDNPLDLSHVTALVPHDSDWTATQLYAGDMQGNVWRFDVSHSSTWSLTGERIAAFGPTQPITALPSVEYEVGNLTRWVFVGTGRLLSSGDLTNKDQQSFYAIKDGVRDQFDKDLKDIGRSQLEKVSIAGDTFSGDPSKKGWYLDFNRSGERIIAPFTTNTGVAVFATFVPALTDPCVPGEGSTFVRSWSGAENLLKDPAAVSAGYLNSSLGIAGVQLLLTKDGVKVIVTNYRGQSSEAKTNIPGAAPSGSRVLWRIIQED